MCEIMCMHINLGFQFTNDKWKHTLIAELINTHTSLKRSQIKFLRPKGSRHLRDTIMTSHDSLSARGTLFVQPQYIIPKQ